MAIVTTDSKHYTNIANAIREDAAVSTTYAPEEMPAGVHQVYAKGKSDGYTEGETAGKAAGRAEVEAENAEILVDINRALAEKLAESADTLQDVSDKIASIQAGGGTDDLPAGFIKVDPSWTNFSQLCISRGSMVQHIKYSDTANGKNFLAMCQQVEASVIPSWDLRNAISIQNMFIYSGIVEIGEMNIPKVTNAQNAFMGCELLERISFAAECIHVDLDFSSCPKLSDASRRSIVYGYADMTGKTATTLKVHPTVFAKFPDDEKAILSAKNVNLAS